ncbi:unnamed protein product [Sphagnum compactum]
MAVAVAPTTTHAHLSSQFSSSHVRLCASSLWSNAGGGCGGEEESSRRGEVGLCSFSPWQGLLLCGNSQCSRLERQWCFAITRQQRKVDGATSPSACAVPRPPRIAAQKPSLLTNPCLETKTSPSLKFWVLTASTSEELLAAATLRAQVFYVYPQLVEKYTEGVEAVKERVAHNFQVADLLKTRTKSEFNREIRIQALGMRVKCLLAVCERSALDSFLLSAPGVGIADTAMRSLLAPPELSSMEVGKSNALVAIGTLDIQDGTGTQPTADVNLVTFQLYSVAHSGKQQKQISKAKTLDDVLPLEVESTLEQGYIFNLCVVKRARQQGVAKALMQAALQVAKQMHLRILYVHVEANNPPALALYKGLGYSLEQEESVEVETRLNRPRRLLLSFWVT